MSDVYQDRYLEHQQRKADTFKPMVGDIEWREYSPEEQETIFDMFTNRRSQRTYNRTEIEQEKIDKLLELMTHCPSSCNRQAISVSIVSDRDAKEFLSGLLVGGVGWCHRADKIILLFADMEAYKSPYEREFMPYLDAGAMIQTIYLACETLGVGTAYINPNIREHNQEIFNERYNPKGLRYCGAMACGYYDLKNLPPKKREIEEMLVN